MNFLIVLQEPCTDQNELKCSHFLKLTDPNRNQRIQDE